MILDQVLNNIGTHDRMKKHNIERGIFFKFQMPKIRFLSETDFNFWIRLY